MKTSEWLFRLLAVSPLLLLSFSTLAIDVPDGYPVKLPGVSPTVPVVLHPRSDGTSLDISVNIVGRCGKARVEIMGVDPISLHDSTNFKPAYDGSELFLTINFKRTHYPAVYSDWNIVRCVNTKHGKWLLFGSYCGGTSCSEIYNFTIIDTRTGRVYPKSGSCDAWCVNRYLGYPYFTRAD